MSSREIEAYFDATEHRPTLQDLIDAVGLVEGPRIAIDCGCGAGSDIAFLRSQGFSVHAFDIEEGAIARCEKRFANDPEVLLSCDSFTSFDYPNASLIVADASLFFCPPDAFAAVWENIRSALLPGGVFVGSFLGPDDSMAGPDYDSEAFWPEVLLASEAMLDDCFADFDIHSFTEHRSSGLTPTGRPHDWHIYALIARKQRALD